MKGVVDALGRAALLIGMAIALVLMSTPAAIADPSIHPFGGTLMPLI